MKLRYKIILGIIFAWCGLHFSWNFGSYAYAIDYDDINNNTIASTGYLNGGVASICEKAIEKTIQWALEHPTISGGKEVVTIPKYEWLDGKYNMEYTLNTGESLSFLVRCTIVTTNYNTTTEDIIVGNDGLKYIPNCIYFTIYRSDGYYKRYYVLNTNRQMDISTSYSSYITINNYSSSYNECYDVSDGSDFGTLVNSNFTMSKLYFYSRDVNSITCVPNDFISSDYPFMYWTKNNSSSYTAYKFPLDSAIYTNQLSAYFKNTSGSSSNTTFNAKFYLSWYETNSQTAYNNAVTMNTYNVNNFTYNNTYPYNTKYDYTTINNSYNTNWSQYYYDDFTLRPNVTLPDINLTPELIAGLLKPYFDIDGKLLPDIDFKLPVDLDFSDMIPDLITEITNRFGNMPAINVDWSTGGNNYFDIDLPSPTLPDSGGGGGGTITPWQPPEFPEHTTSFIISAPVTTFTTDYLNADVDDEIIDMSKEVVSYGYNIWVGTGLISVLIFLTGFALVWRFTGGEK